MAQLTIPIAECQLCWCTSSLEIIDRRLKKGEPPINNRHGAGHKCPCHNPAPVVLNMLVRDVTTDGSL